MPPIMSAHERKTQTNIRLTATGRTLLNSIADHYGITHGNVIEMLLRAEASRLNIRPKTPSAHSPPPFKKS